MTEKPKTLKTEDTGKTLEMAICLAYGIPYDGEDFKYSMEKAEVLSKRLSQLLVLFDTPTHTAKKGARYDFTNTNGEHLSAKTSKKTSVCMVAPQVIGQAAPKKFCDIIGIEYVDVPTLKHFLQDNVALILEQMCNYTFDCPNLHYIEQSGVIRYITLETPIDWSQYSYIWTQNADSWKNSSTLKINCDGKFIALAEFQFHGKSRTNMANRWNYKNFLLMFSKNLRIIVL